jgi:multidrug efflux pump subunit AcrA (membrane-fusion protein)
MKRNLWMLVLVFVLVLSACSQTTTATPLPTVVLDGGSANSPTAQPAAQVSGGGLITASGVVMPIQEAQLAFALGGNIKKVYVGSGDLVKVGDVLAELDNDAVQAEVDQAQRTVRELTSQAAVAAAEQAVATSQITYDDAKKKVASITYDRADQATLDYYDAQLVLAQDALDRAKEVYRKTSDLSSADPIRARANANLFNSQMAYNRALSDLTWYAGKPSENDIAEATANFDAATAALQEAKWYLSELKGESIPADATGTQLARLEQARDALKTAQDKLDHTRLLSPISGAVTTVNIVAGEYVTPGQVVITLSDVANLQVVTKDLSERDVPNISVGQNVKVSVDALNVEITGHVESISSVADTLGGDVIYKTTIALDNLPDGVRAGMSVTVQFLP